MMKNCGSAGLMSLDEDRTMLTLFDNRNKAHVVVTYSPNEKRISGDEGIGGSAVKEKYHDYILDLVKFLGVRFDAQKTKSDHLKVKYLLYDFAQKLEKLPSGGIFDNYFKFSVNNQEYYTNGYLVVSDADIKRAEALMNRGEIKLKNDQGDIIKNVFNHLNRSILSSHGMVYTSIEEFSRNKGNS
jgi:hypothetical protein